MRAAPRILIVEDRYVTAVDCELYLRAAGMECVGVVMTTAGALEVAERERPDLIVMDIHVPEQKEGIAAAIAIYERLGIRSVFVTTASDEAARLSAARAHPLAWVDKPYTSECIVSAVRSALEELKANPAATIGDSELATRTLH
jgi:DNA-binding NarL/FixJ family response regulator